MPIHRSLRIFAPVVAALAVATPAGGSVLAQPAAAGNAAPAEVEVTLDDYSITMPDPLAAGRTRLVATNEGAEEHHLVLARVHDDSTVEEVFATYPTDPAAALDLVDMYPGPNSVAPGATGVVEVDLPAGQYIALCLIPGHDGMPHAAMGMLKLVSVTGDAANTATESEHEAELTLFEYGLVLSPEFDGVGRVLITNDGDQPHEVSIVRIGEGGSYEEVYAEVAAEGPWVPAVASHYEPAGGVTLIEPGQHAIAEFDLPPGDYVFICYVPDADDHLDHSEHGMIQPVTIAG